MLRTSCYNDFSGNFPRYHICPGTTAYISESGSHWRCGENSYTYSQRVGCFPSLHLKYCACYLSFGKKKSSQPVRTRTMYFIKATDRSLSNSQYSSCNTKSIVETDPYDRQSFKIVKMLSFVVSVLKYFQMFPLFLSLVVK